MIKTLPINENNLLRWYNNTTPTLATSQYAEGLHNGYLYKWRNHNDPLPILVNDILTFYTNFDAPTLDSTKIAVLEDGTVVDDITKYDINVTEWGVNNLKIDLTIPATNTANNKIINLAQVEDSTSENYVKSTKIADVIVGDIRKSITLASGKLLVVGEFTVVGQPYNNAVVFNLDGTIDTTYNFGVGFDGFVSDAIEQADGKIVFIGFFINYKGVAVNQMARVNSNGTLDTTLVSGIALGSNVYLIEIDSLNNIYLGGSGFIYGTSSTFERLYRIDSLGNRDVAYTPTFPTSLNALKIQADNKLLVGLYGQNGVRRLNTNGTTDGTFTSALSGIAVVNDIDLDASGSIYVAGQDLKLSGQAFAKLNSNGTQDNTFLLLLGTIGNKIYVTGSVVTVVSNGAVRDISLTGSLITDYNLSGTSITNFNTVGVIKFVTGVSVSYDGGTTSSKFSLEFEIVVNITYITNCLIVKQLTEKNINNTHLIKFYHNNNIYNYEWGIYDVATGTPYTVRVPSSIKDVSYPVEKTVYKSATSGRSRVTRAVNEKKYNFEIYYGQETTHDAIAIIASLKYFEINTRQYIVDGEYSVEFEQNLNIYKGVLSLIDVAFGARINTCTTLS